MLPIALGLGAGFGIFYLWIYLTGSRRGDRRFCPINHKVGAITVRHSTNVACKTAEEVARAAQAIWLLLADIFPGQPEEFTMEVVSDPKRFPGSIKGGHVLLNLYGCTHADEILDTLAEELYHLRELRAGIEPEFNFYPRLFWDHDDVVCYYALNPHEYRALCFAVAFVGWRRRLLEEVEEYRASHIAT